MSRTFDILCVTLLLLAAAGPRSQAAFVARPELEPLSDEEKARYLQMEGERSLREKIRVGKQRYEERQQFRQEIVNAMHANYEQRRAAILGELPASSPAARGGSADAGAPLLLWLAALGLGSIGVIRYFRRQRAEA